MKNEKGFTLIELLVTIALMLSILAIAIVSFTNISNRKKEEAYKLVKEQIMTAAEQYFDSNEYLFEGLSEDAYGIITVGMLVENDYLNKVTDPRDGKSINNCTQVKVTKKNGKYISEFIEFDNVKKDNNGKAICKSNYSITVSEPGAPGISYNFYRQSDRSEINVANKDEWFNISKLGENGKLGVKVTGTKNGNGNIVGISNCQIDGKGGCTNFGNYLTKESSYMDNESFSDNTNGKNVCYKVTNISGKSAYTCAYAKVDTEAPTITTYIENENQWVNDNPEYGYDVIDNISGIDRITNYWNKYGLSETEANSSEYKWNSTDNNGYNGYPQGKGVIEVSGDRQIQKQDYYFVAEGVRKYKAQACDKAGNCADGNERIVKIDKTAPECGITLSGKNNGGNKVGDVQWYIGNDAKVTFNITKSDALSGIDNNYTYTIAEQTDETLATSKNIKVYDKAGNSKECTSPNYGIEKSVKIVFDTEKSNVATSTRKPETIEKKTIDFSQYKVFNTEKGACGYGTCANENIKCYADEKKTNKCGSVLNTDDDTTEEYFAKSCMYVSGHLRYFKATGMSVGTNVSIDDETTNGKVSTEDPILRKGGNDGCGLYGGPNYYYKTCGIGTGTTLVSYVFKYTSPAGNVSNGIRLITEYTVECLDIFPKYK